MPAILVVDDEKSIRIGLSEFLREDGHDVCTAEDTDKALEYAHTRNFDIVVTDLVMPGASGVELLHRLRENYPRTPVIMMTGGPTIETATEALKSGAFDYLLKPVSAADIRKAVSQALKTKELADEKDRLQHENMKYQRNLEELVEKRTAALQRKERQIADLSRRERELVKRDLHDGICQQLVGITFLADRLQRDLDESPELADTAAQIYRLAHDTVEMARQIATGLNPLMEGARPLSTALDELASNVMVIYDMPCEVKCDKGVAVLDKHVATQLYLIAQEAVRNAAKHSQASRIDILMTSNGGGLKLEISDNGVGFSQKDDGPHDEEAASGRAAEDADPQTHTGMGLDILASRAKIIGADLRIRSDSDSGTSVVCYWQDQG